MVPQRPWPWRGGSAQLGHSAQLAVFRDAGGFQGSPPASRALTRRGASIRKCVEDLQEP